MLQSSVPATLITKKAAVVAPTYTALQINHILNLAQIHMQPTEPGLFKLCYNVDEAEFFKRQVLPMINVEMGIDDLHALIERTIAASPVQYRLDSMNHVWAHLIKTSMKNCSLIDFDVSTIVCWQIFITDLKRIYEEYLPTMRAQEKSHDFSLLNKEAIQNVFLRFLADLEAVGNKKLVRVFHQFLFIVKRVANDASTMSLNELGTFVGPSLHYALLRNYFPEQEVDNVNRDECGYFAKITAIWLEHPIFDRSYEASDYRPFYVPQSRALDLRDQLREKVRSLFCPVTMLTFCDPVVALQKELAKVEINGSQEKKRDKKERSKRNSYKDKITAEATSSAAAAAAAVASGSASLPPPSIPVPKRQVVIAPTPQVLNAFEQERAAARPPTPGTPRQSPDNDRDAIDPNKPNIRQL